MRAAVRKAHLYDSHLVKARSDVLLVPSSGGPVGIHQVKLQVQRSCGDSEQETKKRPTSKDCPRFGGGTVRFVFWEMRTERDRQAQSWGRRLRIRPFNVLVFLLIWCVKCRTSRRKTQPWSGRNNKHGHCLGPVYI